MVSEQQNLSIELRTSLTQLVFPRSHNRRKIKILFSKFEVMELDVFGQRDKEERNETPAPIEPQEEEQAPQIEVLANPMKNEGDAELFAYSA